MKLAPALLVLVVLVARTAAADHEPAFATAHAAVSPWALPIAAGLDTAIDVDPDRAADRPLAAESPWTVRIAAGTYAPVVDTSLLVLGEVDRQRRFAGGRIGFAASAGFLQTCAQLAPHRTLQLFPLFAGAVYRTPPLGFAFAPLVLSAKLGPAYQVWRREDAQGAKLGWRGSAGVAIRLDQLDPDAQRAFANDVGIDHTAISLELTYFGVDGFPRTLTWSLGLDFDF